ncbi:MAG: FecR domain-containing protein [Rhodospirillales bacterium]|nr:FecR domain-containing protein [Rhodospirillales bacterium]
MFLPRLRFFGVFVFLSGAILTGSAFAQAPQPIGSVVETEGSVTFSGTNGTSAARPQDNIYPYATIKTGPQSRALILLIDDTEITLGENAELSLDEYVFDPGDPQENKGRFSFLRGAFVYVSGMLAKRSPPDVTLKTSYGSIGIRGTTVWGGPVDDGFGVFVENGEVLFNGESGSVRVPQGAGTFLKRGSVPRPANAWPREKISQMKARLAFAQGREAISRRVREQMVKNVERRSEYRRIVWPYKPREWRAPLDPKRGAPFTKEFRQQDKKHRERLQGHDQRLRDGLGSEKKKR